MTSKINKEKSREKIFNKIKNPKPAFSRYQYLEKFICELNLLTERDSIVVIESGKQLLKKLTGVLCFAHWRAGVRSVPRYLRVLKILDEL